MGSDSSTSTSPPPPRPAQHHHVHRRHLRVCFPLELQRVAYRRRCPRRECSQDGGRQARPRGDPGRGCRHHQDHRWGQELHQHSQPRQGLQGHPSRRDRVHGEPVTVWQHHEGHVDHGWQVWRCLCGGHCSRPHPVHELWQCDGQASLLPQVDELHSYLHILPRHTAERVSSDGTLHGSVTLHPAVSHCNLHRVCYTAVALCMNTFINLAL